MIPQPASWRAASTLTCRDAGTRRTKDHVVYKAEYIWIDGTEPTSKLRSKTKIVPDGAPLPVWGFDGSSTNQATGDKSDCVLIPVFSCPDPIRGGDDVLVMCRGVLRRRQAASRPTPAPRS